jgi:hypothetical protein
MDPTKITKPSWLKPARFEPNWFVEKQQAHWHG